MHFELDVTKPVGDFSITTPEGKITYDVMAITKEPMALFQAMFQADRSDRDDTHELMMELIETLSSVMTPQNGGPPADELFTRLYQEGFLGINHMYQIGDYVQKTAVGNPPA